MKYNNSKVEEKVFKGVLAGDNPLPLLLLPNPTLSMEAVTRGYVDQSTTSLNASSLVGKLTAPRLGAFTGVHVTSVGGGVFSYQPSGVVAGDWTKYTVNAKGLVTAGGVLTGGDVPLIPWSKITAKPTTLAGYGVGDAASVQSPVFSGFVESTHNYTTNSQLLRVEDVLDLTKPGDTVQVPTGTIVFKSPLFPQEGYFRCNGAMVPATTHYNLFSALGHEYPEYTGDHPFYGGGVPWRNNYRVISREPGAVRDVQENVDLVYHCTHGSAAVLNGFLYTFGGAQGVAKSSQYVSKYAISEAGDLTFVSSEPLLPKSLADVLVVVFDHKLYVLGGTSNGAVSSNTYFCNLDEGGELGGFQNGPTLPAGLTFSDVLCVQGRLYLFGVTTLYSTIGYMGTLQTWQTFVTPLTTQAVEIKTVAIRDRVYAVLGNTTKSFYCAPIQTGGVLGSWVAKTNLPEDMKNPVIFATNKKIYVLSGPLDKGGGNNAVYSTPIDADRNTGVWTLEKTLSMGLKTPCVAMVGAKLHFLGGLHSTNSKVKSFSFDFNGGRNDYREQFFLSEAQNFTYFVLPDLSSEAHSGLFPFIKT